MIYLQKQMYMYFFMAIKCLIPNFNTF